MNHGWTLRTRTARIISFLHCSDIICNIKCVCFMCDIWRLVCYFGEIRSVLALTNWSTSSSFGMMESSNTLSLQDTYRGGRGEDRKNKEIRGANRLGKEKSCFTWIHIQYPDLVLDTKYERHGNSINIYPVLISVINSFTHQLGIRSASSFRDVIKSIGQLPDAPDQHQIHFCCRWYYKLKSVSFTCTPHFFSTTVMPGTYEFRF